MIRNRRKMIGNVLMLSGIATMLNACVSMQSKANDTGYGAVPMQLTAVSSKLTFSIDDSAENIYGISVEVRGTPGFILQALRYETYDADGTERQKVGFQYGNYPFYQVELQKEWQTLRLEVFTKQGAASLNVFLSQVPPESEVFFRNAKIVPGGFPENPPVPGTPYLSWINDLKANTTWAAANPFFKPDEVPSGFSDSDLALRKAEVAAYLELPLERLVELMPTQRLFGSFYEINQWKPFGKWPCLNWDPREPDILRDEKDNIVQPKDATVQATGIEEAVAPSGKLVYYPYYDPNPSSTTDNSRYLGLSNASWGNVSPDCASVISSDTNRIYIGLTMSSTRIMTMMRAAYIMAGIYRRTGEYEYASRAAVILAALLRAVPDWPIHGSLLNEKRTQFFPPDNYDHWFAFIVGHWYTPCITWFNTPAQTYDLLREAPVWDEVSKALGSDARTLVHGGLLHVVRYSLKYDAYRRTNPWELFHNTIGNGQLNTYNIIGRILGCPELIHYAVAKAAAAASTTIMADGMFPESTSYIQDHVGGLNNGFEKGRIQGYSDPQDYVCAFDGRRIDNFSLTREIPLLARTIALMKELTFPDGTVTTIHDTWAGSRPSIPGLGRITRTITAPFLIPDFGHARLGYMGISGPVEAHLHYSGTYNHNHSDMLNFSLWAYGDELVSDQGYTHFPYNPQHTAAHNLVVVDGQEQNTTHRGDLLVWRSGSGAAQIAQVADNQAYTQASRYRRSVISIPFGGGRDAVIDIFEVQGGKSHEWMANGCADYNQTVDTSLMVDPSSAAATRSLAADGIVLKGGEAIMNTRNKYGAPNKFYGTFRTVGAPAQWQTPWQVTMLPPAPVPAGTPGAGARATTSAQKPSLRLHMLAPDDAQPILCWTPRHRYANESSVWDKPDVFWKWWDANLMPKVVARREGADLDSTFVAVWEPYLWAPWLTETHVLPEIPIKEGVGVRVRDSSATATLLYRRPESRATLRTDTLLSNGIYTLFREEFGQFSLDLAGGAEAVAGSMRLSLQEWPTLKVMEQGIENGLPWLRLKGTLPGYPAEAANQPHAGQFVRFVQEGQVAWWLPVAQIETAKNGDTILRLSREIGFMFDAKDKILRETAYPFRVLRGAATVEFPTGANLSWSISGTGETKTVLMKIRADSITRLGLTAPFRLNSAAVRTVGETEWQDLKIFADGMVELPVGTGTRVIRMEVLNSP